MSDPTKFNEGDRICHKLNRDHIVTVLGEGEVNGKTGYWVSEAENTKWLLLHSWTTNWVRVGNK